MDHIIRHNFTKNCLERKRGEIKNIFLRENYFFTYFEREQG